jgi:hypothetical protein
MIRWGSKLMTWTKKSNRPWPGSEADQMTAGAALFVFIIIAHGGPDVRRYYDQF